MREVPLTSDKTTLDPEEALKMCDENTICVVPIQGVTWTGLNDDVEALDKALDAYNAKTGYDIPIHVDAPPVVVSFFRSSIRIQAGFPSEMGTFYQVYPVISSVWYIRDLAGFAGKAKNICPKKCHSASTIWVPTLLRSA